MRETPQCTNCWDKGYATVFEGQHGSPDFIGDKGFDVPPSVHIKYCTCARGKLMKKRAKT